MDLMTARGTLPRTVCAPPAPAPAGVGARPRRDLALYRGGLAAGALGTAVTSVALPSVALVTLDATPVQVGVLAAAQRILPVVTALVAGAWLDRYRKLRLLAWSTAARGLLLLVVPVAAVTGALSLEVLCVLAVALSAVTDVSATAAASYLPSLVRDGGVLAAATGRTGALLSVADSAGSCLAGGLITVLGTSRAFLADVVCCLAGAALMVLIRTPEPPPTTRPAGSTLAREIRAGLGYVRTHRLIRPLVLSNTLLSAAMTAWDVLFLVYAVRQLHWSPAVLGVVTGCAGVGGVVGALAGHRLARPRGTRWGAGPLLLCALAAQPLVLLPVLAAGPGLLWQVMVGACVMGRFAASSAHSSVQRSVRQSACDPRFQGRQDAVGSWATVAPRALSALSALGAGVLAALAGLETAMTIAAAGAAMAFAVLLASPVRRLRALPTPRESL